MKGLCSAAADGAGGAFFDAFGALAGFFFVSAFFVAPPAFSARSAPFPRLVLRPNSPVNAPDGGTGNAAAPAGRVVTIAGFTFDLRTSEDCSILLYHLPSDFGAPEPPHLEDGIFDIHCFPPNIVRNLPNHEFAGFSLVSVSLSSFCSCITLSHAL